ncbi:hypothetical protein FRC20_011718 [Serendipita sp. 405]|nr:hypothetical protein FRC16_006752 [Serendipita sp. 398]KAG8870536.1 hypothetical protein FRC20_011718 [Serendipita sp. 405]
MALSFVVRPFSTMHTCKDASRIDVPPLPCSLVPTRYGRAVAQVSAFFDSTGGLWGTQALNGKMATIITSTGTQHGGQETTVLTTLPYLAHHGIIFVPLGYADKNLTQMNEIMGGSPWGAATLAASDGSRQPSKIELDMANFHAGHFANTVKKYVS